jgi:hypothetical protein
MRKYKKNKEKESFFDKFIKVGLILGAFFLGTKFLKYLSEPAK